MIFILLFKLFGSYFLFYKCITFSIFRIIYSLYYHSSTITKEEMFQSFQQSDSIQDQEFDVHKKYDEIKYRQSLTYSFPVKLLALNTIKGKDQFKMLLDNQSKQSNKHQYRWTYKKRQIKNGLRMHINCNECKAKIIYRINQDQTWSLEKYNNSHVHSIESKKVYKVLTQLAIFQNISLSNDRLHKVVSSSYPMNRKQLLKKKRDLLKNSNFELLKAILRHLNYSCKFQHSESDHLKKGYPQTLVAVSNEQKSNYRKYGESVSYDITYNCIKETSFDGKKYGVGIFSGFDTNKRIIIFGLSITTFQTTDSFKNVFNWFFDLMGYMHTTAIITDQQKTIISALQFLKNKYKYQFHHIYDNWHFLKTFKNTLKLKGKKIERNSNLIQILKKTMKQSDPNVGIQYLQILKSEMQRENLSEQYQNLQNKIEHVCLWKMPNIFLGLSFHSNECLNNLLKMKVQHETTMYQLVQKFDKCSIQRTIYSQNNVTYQKFPFELIYEDNRIQEVRQKLQKKIFMTFIYNYNRSQIYKIKQKSRNIQQKYTYEIEHTIDGDCYQIHDFQCQCNLLQKTGIACQHIIFIIKNQYPNRSYLNFINERWFPFQKNDINLNRSRGGKKSRKNRLR